MSSSPKPDSLAQPATVRNLTPAAPQAAPVDAPPEIDQQIVKAASIIRSLQYASIGNGLYCRVGRRRLK